MPQQQSFVLRLNKNDPLWASWFPIIAVRSQHKRSHMDGLTKEPLHMRFMNLATKEKKMHNINRIGKGKKKLKKINAATISELVNCNLFLGQDML